MIMNIKSSGRFCLETVYGLIANMNMFVGILEVLIK